MDKCGDGDRNCYEDLKSCSGDYVVIPINELKYKCCLTDDVEVAEVLNEAAENNHNTTIMLISGAIFVLLTSIHSHNATKKIRNGTAKASRN